MSLAEIQARQHPPVRTRGDAPIALGEVVPLKAELRTLANEVLRSLQYSFLAAAAHPEIRFPFGSLEEAFQDAIALRAAKQRWGYHARARPTARLPLSSAIPPSSGRVLWSSLTLYISEVACLHPTTPEVPTGEEITLGGLAFDANGQVIKVEEFLVRPDFENGVLKNYGIPGRKFCEFAVPDLADDSLLTYGAAVFLAGADCAGYSDALAAALAKTGAMIRSATEACVPQVAGRVVEQFGQWMAEALQDDLFAPGLAFAGLHPALVADDMAGDPGQLTFWGGRGRYRVTGQWRVSPR